MFVVVCVCLKPCKQACHWYIALYQRASYRNAQIPPVGLLCHKYMVTWNQSKKYVYVIIIFFFGGGGAYYYAGGVEAGCPLGAVVIPKSSPEPKASLVLCPTAL